MNNNLPYYNQLNLPDNVLKNFWKKVNIPNDYENDCWLWNAALNIDGYGAFSVHILKNKKKHYRAHKFVYESYFGKIDDDLLVCHTCDVRNCVSPYHLFPGTSIENNLDRDNKNRGYYLSGDDLPNTIISDAQVKIILDDILNNKFKNVQEICNLYNVGLMTIWDILYGKTRKDISKNYNLTQLKMKITKKITNNELILIKHDFKYGFNISQLMLKYGRTRFQIRYALFNRKIK